MGAKACKLEIQVDQKEVTAGDVLTGRVCVKCEKIKSLPLRVTLVFLGQEIAHIQPENSKSKRQYDAKTSSSRQLCRSEVTLERDIDWSDTVSTKTYVRYLGRSIV